MTLLISAIMLGSFVLTSAEEPNADPKLPTKEWSCLDVQKTLETQDEEKADAQIIVIRDEIQRLDDEMVFQGRSSMLNTFNRDEVATMIEYVVAACDTPMYSNTTLLNVTDLYFIALYNYRMGGLR